MQGPREKWLGKFWEINKETLDALTPSSFKHEVAQLCVFSFVILKVDFFILLQEEYIADAFALKKNKGSNFLLVHKTWLQLHFKSQGRQWYFQCGSMG